MSAGGPRRFLESRGGRAALVAGVASIFGLVLAVGVPLCPTATFLGVPCPGCGLTRATLRLLHGDVAGAMTLHPLALLLAPLLAVLVAKGVYDYVRGAPPVLPVQNPRSARITTVAGSLLFAALLFVWGARFFGAFGGPVSVDSPGRALIERALRHDHGAASTSARAHGDASSAEALKR